ncbi:MAG: HlyD family efflux transporter periplasmic adaptor subunit [Hyphomicrobium sp.]
MTRLLIATLSILLLAGAANAHGDDDHSHDDAPVAAAGLNTPQVELTGGDLELVALIADRTLTIYLDHQATNAPVAGATIKVTVDGVPAGTAKESSTGIYALAAPWADEPGHKPLKFSITADGKETELVGELDIAAAAAEAPAAAVSWLALLASPATWLLAALAAASGFVAAFAFRPMRIQVGETGPAKAEGKPQSGLSRALMLLLLAAPLLATQSTGARAHDGEDHADEAPAAAQASPSIPRRMPDGAVYLPKASQRLLGVRTVVARFEAARPSRELIGTVVPDPSSFGQVQAPMDGRIELAARGVSNVGQRVEAGEVLAYLAPSIPIADLGTMQQLRAEVAGKLKIAEQKLARLERIASVVAQRDIDDTRADLEALREQQRVLSQKDVELMPLKAPVSGVISVANVRAGQVVTTRDTLFEIVDPHRLWIEAISGAEHAAPSIAAAYANDADGHSIKLAYIGRAPALRQQTQPLVFKVDEQHDGLVIGSAVKVFVQQGEPIDGFVLPDAAVVRGQDGLPRVWIKTGPQQFRPQPVRVAPLDGNNIVVLAGIEDQSRVVIDGAELLNQVR